MVSFLASLNDEWRTLAGGPQARRALHRWAARYPVFAGLTDLTGVLQRRSTDKMAAAEILTALAELAPADELAARTLLHALMPGIVRFARATGHDDDQALEEMVSLAWERIRTYPAERPGSVAANVLWDVRKRYRRHRYVDAPRSTPLPAQYDGHQMVRSAEDEALDRVMVEGLVTACRGGVIARQSYELIMRTRFAGVPLREIASEQNVSSHALAQRRWRAERRLMRELPVAG